MKYANKLNRIGVIICVVLFACWYGCNSPDQQLPNILLILGDDMSWNDFHVSNHPDSVVVPPFLFDGEKTRRDLASYYNEISRFDYYIGEVVKELEKQGILDNTIILVMADNGRA